MIGIAVLAIGLPANTMAGLAGVGGVGLPGDQAPIGKCPALRLPVTTDTVAIGNDRLWDYGDAPDNTNNPGMTTFYTPPGAPIGMFPTLWFTANSMFGTPGARHRVVNVGWLGNWNAYPGPGSQMLNVMADLPPTREWDADLFPDEDTTMTNLVGATPDHDGRDDSVPPQFLFASGVGTVTFRVSSNPGITQWYVNILFDWDYNGVWTGVDPMNGAPEWVTQNMVVSVPALTSTTFTTLPFLAGSNPYEPWMRITLSDTPVPAGVYGMPGWDGSTPPGTFDHEGYQAFACGETEDYCGQVMVRPKPGQWSEFQVWCERQGHGG